MEITMDEICTIIGVKELELFQARKELMQTRKVLEEVTRSAPQEKGDGETTDDDAARA